MKDNWSISIPVLSQEWISGICKHSTQLPRYTGTPLKRRIELPVLTTLLKKFIKNQFMLVMVLFLFGCQKSIPQFSGTASFKHLEYQCQIGDRIPNSPEIQLCRDYIISNLKKTDAKVTLQKFDYAEADTVLNGVNILASFYPQLSRRILLVAHYDTRIKADQETDEEKREMAVPGANDGASGVAVLLEIGARLGQQEPKEFGVDLLFVDLEDVGKEGEEKSWCQGSRYFVENMGSYNPEKIIILDMIGDKDLKIKIEGFSWQSSPALVKQIWDIANKSDFTSFSYEVGTPIMDDHVPFLEKGLNAIDIIDFEYPYWHKTTDTVDKCSDKSLYQIGQTIINLIYSNEE